MIIWMVIYAQMSDFTTRKHESHHRKANNIWKSRDSPSRNRWFTIYATNIYKNIQLLYNYIILSYIYSYIILTITYSHMTLLGMILKSALFLLNCNFCLSASNRQLRMRTSIGRTAWGDVIRAITKCDRNCSDLPGTVLSKLSPLQGSSCSHLRCLALDQNYSELIFITFSANFHDMPPVWPL